MTDRCGGGEGWHGERGGVGKRQGEEWGKEREGRRIEGTEGVKAGREWNSGRGERRGE